LSRWHREQATDGNGFWFVSPESSRVDVLAPPATALGRRAEPSRRNAQLPSGWRWATWLRQEDQELSVDEDPPDAVREVDTATVLVLLDAESHELVWSCLWGQLQIARQIGRQSPGQVPSEDLSRAGALSAVWLQRELARAFPKRAALLEPAIADDHCDWLRDDLDPCAEEHTPLHALARWFSYKVEVSESDCPNTRHIWHAGELLHHTYQSDPNPGDHSAFDWGNSAAANENDLLTEEFLLP
jgi:hypothetical protein